MTKGDLYVELNCSIIVVIGHIGSKYNHIGVGD